MKTDYSFNAGRDIGSALSGSVSRLRVDNNDVRVHGDGRMCRNGRNRRRRDKRLLLSKVGDELRWPTHPRIHAPNNRVTSLEARVSVDVSNADRTATARYILDIYE